MQTGTSDSTSTNAMHRGTVHSVGAIIFYLCGFNQSYIMLVAYPIFLSLKGPPSEYNSFGLATVFVEIVTHSFGLRKGQPILAGIQFRYTTCATLYLLYP